MNRTERMFEDACSIYAEHGVDVKEALRKLDSATVGIHAWQGDDVVGFENTGHALTGGCQVTGNYPGRARTAEELRQDLDEALAMIPGPNKIVLQGHEVDSMIPGCDRDAFTIENFSGWAEWSFTQDGFPAWGAKLVESLSPTALGWVYSIVYNGFYMVPELILTAIAAQLIARIPKIVVKVD